MRLFIKAVREKTYNTIPPRVCGTNVARMIQADLVSRHVVYHFVQSADLPNRTKDDLLKSGIWPGEFDPKRVLCTMNDGQTIFKDNPMLVLTPLDKDGWPIEVPRGIYMIAFVDLQVLVNVA